MATVIQITDRKHHGSNSGIEIIRTFSVEPYEDYIDVMKELQGFVRDGKRFPPTRDPYVPVCYCTEARAEQWDDAQLTTSEDLTNKGQNTIRQMLEDVKEKPREGTAGAKVTAIYRPLITAWDSDDGPSSRWDWLDVRVVPGVREIPWPLGLSLKAHAIGPDVRTVPNNVASPLRISVDDIFVRRILVPSIPRDKLTQAEGCVNTNVFPNVNTPPGEEGSPFPKCEPRTLLFVGTKVLNMMDAEGNRWYEIELHFQRIVAWSTIVADFDGDLGENWVTWNHVLTRPFGAPLAWYEVFLNAQRTTQGAAGVVFDLIPGLQLRDGRLHREADFSPLFEL